jgi:hypothetical protein
VLAALLVGCARNVPQDSATGDDGKVKGAKPIELDNNEGRATGIVTYPGGDRVDWKVLELPEGKRGELELELAWKPPRQKLQLTMDVFDQWGRKAGRKYKAARHSAYTTIEDAKSKYFIRIAAARRGDAGKYRLFVKFRETVDPTAGSDLTMVPFPEPPKLPDVPVSVPEEPCLVHDPKNPACKPECASGAPPNWPGCKDKCPDPPSPDNPKCWDTMPCPRGQPDERIKSCTAADWPPCPDKTNPDLRNPNCRVKPKPVLARILERKVEGGEVVIRIGAGTAQGITRDWTGVVLRERDINAAPIIGGEFKLYRVDTDRSFGRVKLTPDQVAKHLQVRLSPP